MGEVGANSYKTSSRDHQVLVTVGWEADPRNRRPNSRTTVSAIKSAQSQKYMRFFKYTEIYDTDIFLKLLQALRIGLGMFLNVKHRNGRYQHH